MVALTTPFGRLAAWARALPEGADLPEHYPSTAQGAEDIAALLTEIETSRKEGSFW